MRRLARSRLLAVSSAIAVATAIALSVPTIASAGSGAAGARSTVRPASARPAWATRANYLRPAAAGQRIQVAILLGFRNPAALASLAHSVSDPRSASYAHYLSPAAFRARFSPSASSAAAAASWLRGAGLRVGRTPLSRLFVPATGTVAQVESAFGVALGEYRVGGKALRAPATDPAIPASLRGIARGIVGLTEVRMRPSVVRQAPPPPGLRSGQPCSAYWGELQASDKPQAYGQTLPYAPCGYTPQQIQGAYGVDQTIASGIDGTGQTVAVVDAYHAKTIKFDLATYSQRHGLPAPQLTQINAVPARGNKADKQGWYGEETLDLEAVHSMAPGAALLFEGTASPDNSNFDLSYADILDNGRASIVSTSGGDPELSLPPSDIATEEALYQQAVAQGVGMFFSSGDCGDEIDPDGLCGGAGQRETQYPASSPNVTAVGGTSLAVGASNDYLFETGWGTGYSFLNHPGTKWKPAPPGYYFYGGGGGTSQLFDEPTYQQGVVPEDLSGYFGGENRVVPDIAAVGDPNTGFLVGETQTFPDGTYYDEYRLGGTSLSCPLVAGMFALVNQAAGYDLGFVNPALYGASGSDGFRDVTDPASTVAVVRTNFNNDVDGSDGLNFSVRTMNFTGTLHTLPGYDDVTGLGSPNLPDLIARLTS